MNLIRSFIQPYVYVALKWYYRKPRLINKRGIRFTLHPSVFHPTLYQSTDVLLDYILTCDLSGKKILELGCGSGFISLYLAKNTSAYMHASDINPRAVEGLSENARELELKIMVYQSDLFDQLPNIAFDYILVNPPFFKRPVSAPDEHAFFAGRDFEYFRKFFQQIIIRMHENLKVIMVFSENAKLSEIRELALQHDVEMVEFKRVKKWREWFVLYELYGYAPLKL